jgi:hypothetical protein
VSLAGIDQALDLTPGGHGLGNCLHLAALALGELFVQSAALCHGHSQCPASRRGSRDQGKDHLGHKHGWAALLALGAHCPWNLEATERKERVFPD